VIVESGLIGHGQISRKARLRRIPKAIVDDAVAMLTNLAEAVGNDMMNPLSAHTMPTMAIDEVEAFLDRTERAV
jgi:hypothetical protein